MAEDKPHPTEEVECPTTVEGTRPANADLEKQNTLTRVQRGNTIRQGQDSITHVPSHVSGHDIANLQHYETGDEVYDRFSPHRKIMIVTILSVCSFLAPVSSTTILAAVPEVAKTYNSTGTIINLSNAFYQLFMGLSPMLWGPLGTAYGRRWTQVAGGIGFTAFSAGTALSPNLASFFVFRLLTAFFGTCFLIIGSTCIGDIYRPTERATAISWFFSGALIGPALGPFIGGVIVTYRPWQDIFWLQTALSGAALIMVLLFLPETIHYKKAEELKGLSKRKKAAKLAGWINPLRVLALFRYPNLLLAGCASGALVWNMYSLLTPIRYVLNPRFGLSSPMQSGLFYLAPGCGYLLGTFFGGRWADRTVKKWIIKREGLRVPEDRLRSCLGAVGIVIPGCMLIYGWSIDKNVGGIPLPVIVMFVQGVAQLFCFPALNSYCLDVMRARGAEVIAGNYAIRYLFGCVGSAVVLPFVERYGVGWFSTMVSFMLMASALGVWAVTIWGASWRTAIEEKKSQRGGHHGEESPDEVKT